jgi:hypothetical protein
MQNAELVRVVNAGHIPTESDPRAVGVPLAAFLAAHAAGASNG